MRLESLERRHLLAQLTIDSPSILEGDGTRTVSFAAAVHTDLGLDPQSSAAADIDGDGDLDLLFANRNSTGDVLYRNNGTANFTAIQNFATNVDDIGFVDVDRDGDVDLAASQFLLDTLSITRNDGAGLFQNKVHFSAGSILHSLAAGDFDGDLDQDIAISEWGSDVVRILSNNGAGGFALTSSPAAGRDPAEIAVGDIDADGDVDLVVASTATASITVLKNNGAATFTSTTVSVGSTPVSLALVDLDRDGDLDVATANSASNDVTILTNNGQGAFTNVRTVIVGANPLAIAAADLDGDGDADLAVTNNGDDTVSLLMNAGNATFTAAANSPLAVQDGPGNVLIRDFNGDGEPDLIVGNRTSRSMSYFRNTTTFATWAVLTVTLDTAPAAGETISVDFATAGGTATPGVDYSPVSGTLRFGPGATTRQIRVPVVADDVVETAETVQVVLSNPVRATVGVGTGTVTIRDDDQAGGLAPEIGLVGRPTQSGSLYSISDGDTTPETRDGTYFGEVDVATGSRTQDFGIFNFGTSSLTLTGSPVVKIEGTHAADFTVVTQPANSISINSGRLFQVKFDPTGTGVRTAIVKISNNDSDENPYDYWIQGVGTSGTPVAAPAGLISLWRANGSANDELNNNSATLMNGAGATAAGKVGQAFDLDGVDDRVDVDGQTLLFSARTIEAWVYPRASSGDGLPIVTGGKTGAADFFGIAGTTGSCAVGQYELYLDHWGSPCVDSNLAVVPDQWNHVAIVYDVFPSTMTFYVNGVSSGARSGSFYDYFSDLLTIGGNDAGGSSTRASLPGKIDEVALYNRALSATEVQSIYQAGGGGKALAAPEVFIVNSTNDADDGACNASHCSFREALAAANSQPNFDRIAFAPNLSGSINLTGALPPVTAHVAIEGPGANVLTVRRDTGGDYRLLQVNSGITANVTGLTWSNGNALPNGIGGGIVNAGVLIVESSVIDGNVAKVGGGIGNLGYLELRASTVSNNRVDVSGTGGGINNFSGARAQIVLSTISGNRNSVGGGGGISNAGEMAIESSTIANNFARDVGGGLASWGPAIRLHNSIVADNASATIERDLHGDIFSEGYNLIEDTRGGVFSGAILSNITGVDPQLQPLQLNGAATPTHGLGRSSPAIDKGNGGGLVADQRGFPRPVDKGAVINASDGSDIGAFEVPPVPIVTVIGGRTIIGQGDFTPSTADNTDFGLAAVAGGQVTLQFGLANTGERTLNFTGNPRIAISGAHAADFSVTPPPYSSLPPMTSSLDSFQIHFDPSGIGLRSAVVSIASDDPEMPSFSFAIQGTGSTSPEVALRGNNVAIADGDTTPSTADHTDFASTAVAGGTVTRTFTITNTGDGTLNLTGNPRVALSGANAADFTVIAQPAATIAAGGQLTFDIRFDPSAAGLRAATVTIANDDADESSYDFAIQGTGSTSPEVALRGNNVAIADGDTTPSTADHTDFASTAVAGGTVTRTFTITNTGDATLNLTGNPRVALSGANAADFTVIAQPAATIAAGGQLTFDIRFDPSAAGLRAATVTIANDDADESSYDFAIQGTGSTSPEVALRGNNVAIADGDTTPSTADHTDFASTAVAGGTVTRTFTITNTGDATLNLTGNPRVALSGANAADFTVIAQPAATIAAGGQLTFDIRFDPSAAGLRSATVTIANDDADESTYDIAIQGTGTAAPGVLQVDTFTPTSTGFIARFSSTLNVGVLNLYDQGGALGAADIAVTTEAGDPVVGSVVVDAAARSLQFIRTGGVLESNRYRVTMRSSATGLVDSSGGLLDGDRDGVAGGDYTATFDVSAPTNALVVSLPDVVRGHGQTVDIPATSPGLPLTISSAEHVTAVDMALHFDPSLLLITSFTPNPALNISTSLFNTVAPGRVLLTLSSTTPFSTTAGPVTLGAFVATVPSDATYGAKHIVDIADLHVFDDSAGTNEVPSIDNDAIHVAAYFGDANGSQTYNGPDASLAARVIVQINSGFAAYQLADPVLIADINANGRIQGNDTTSIARKIVQIAVPQIPDLPAGSPPTTPTGADPRLYIPTDLTAARGQTVTVPVMMEVKEPAGIDVGAFDLAITYDANAFDLAATRLGATFGGFAGTFNTSQPGQILVNANSANGTSHLPFGQVLRLAEFDLQAKSTAPSGASTVNLQRNVGSTATAIFNNNFDELTLVPAPTNANNDAQIDGLITISTGNSAPTDLTLAPNSVAENQAGAVVGTLTVADPDASDTHTLTVADARFEIVGGQLKLKPGVSLNFEQTAQLTVDVTARDAGGLEYTESMTVLVTNVNERPTDLTLAPNSVAENQAGAVVGTLTVADPDASDTHTLTVADARFEIVGGQLKLKPGVSLSVSQSPHVTLDVTARDAGGLEFTESLTIDVLTNSPLMRISAQVTDANGVPRAFVALGTTFSLRVLVEDLRPSPSGVYAAYADVTFDATRAQTSGDPQFAAGYQTAPYFDVSTPGLLDETGAAATSLSPVGGGAKLLFTSSFVATASGTLSFGLDPADDLPPHAALLFDSNLAIPSSQIEYVGATVDVVRWHNSRWPEDVNADGFVVSLDALLVINDLNARGARSLSGEQLAANYFPDVNDDGFITPLDALRVINYLNRGAGGEGPESGEGEAPGANGGENFGASVGANVGVGMGMKVGAVEAATTSTQSSALASIPAFVAQSPSGDTANPPKRMATASRATPLADDSFAECVDAIMAEL